MFERISKLVMEVMLIMLFSLNFQAKEFMEKSNKGMVSISNKSAEYVRGIALSYL